MRGEVRRESARRACEERVRGESARRACEESVRRESARSGALGWQEQAARKSGKGVDLSPKERWIEEGWRCNLAARRAGNGET